MAITYGSPKLIFGIGFAPKLPEGWVLRESCKDFAIGIDPSGQEHYLSADAAYPKKISEKHIGRLKPGDPYIDLENCVMFVPSPH